MFRLYRYELYSYVFSQNQLRSGLTTKQSRCPTSKPCDLHHSQSMVFAVVRSDSQLMPWVQTKRLPKLKSINGPNSGKKCICHISGFGHVCLKGVQIFTCTLGVQVGAHLLWLQIVNCCAISNFLRSTGSECRDEAEYILPHGTPRQRGPRSPFHPSTPLAYPADVYHWKILRSRRGASGSPVSSCLAYQ